MKPEDAKSIFLLEHCAERCDGYQKDDTCENCEINAAIKAIEKQIADVEGQIIDAEEVKEISAKTVEENVRPIARKNTKEG